MLRDLHSGEADPEHRESEDDREERDPHDGGATEPVADVAPEDAVMQEEIPLQLH